MNKTAREASKHFYRCDIIVISQKSLLVKVEIINNANFFSLKEVRNVDLGHYRLSQEQSTLSCFS